MKFLSVKLLSVKHMLMKRLSIKMRVTLWYSLLMLLLAALVLSFMTFVSEFIAENVVKDALVSVVDANANEVDYDDDDGILDVDSDFAYFKNGVSSAVYSGGFELLDGELPDGFRTGAPLADGVVRTVVSDGQPYLIYDRLVIAAHGGLWVRGIIHAGMGGMIGTVMKAAFILLPFIVLIAALVGYRIAKSAFAPVEKIIEAANAISEGSDLSKRIGLEGSRDEIHRLAATFDSMFSRLEASFEDEKQFTSDVSHELRTPVSVIMSQCEYALDGAHGPAEYRESLETVQRQASRMSRLISQLLAFTRLEQGQEKAALEDTDLSELVTIVCEEQSEIGRGDISLSADIEPGIHVSADRALITRLLSNLIGNAYQYGSPGGWVKVRLGRADGEIILSVSDNGVGIAGEHLDKIWRRFYQVRRSQAADANGSMGLGLSMVKRIAKIHGLTVQAESVLGKGSTFTVKGVS